MQSQERGKKLSAQTVIGLYAVGWSLLGVMSIVYAITHTGLNSLIGWFTLVIANVLVYSTSRYKQRGKRQFNDRTFLILLIVWLSTMVVMITSMAGVWDAR